MAPPTALPHWPTGTVAFLVTAGARPHAIPVSAVVRAGDDRILLGLARRRRSLERLRADPEVTVALCARDVAVSVDGVATVVDEQLTDSVVAVSVQVSELHDHDRPTFALRGGVDWAWTDEPAHRADAEVHAALARLARD
jgi:flavin reductase (DIM6/NTAB) family NADH-FMN oxidoreductase RutF